MSRTEDSYFRAAEKTAREGTCPRARVGCILLLPNMSMIREANGAPTGAETCDEIGCLMEGGHCIRSVHAEVRALAYAALHGRRLEGATAFTTLLPCVNCMQALALAGVITIHYDRSYERSEAEHVHILAERVGVNLIERTRS